MKKANGLYKKLLAAVLVLIMVLAIVPMNSSAAGAFKRAFTPDRKINFATLSDIHYYPKELTNNYCDDYLESLKVNIGREPYESVGILDSALAALADHAKKNGLEYVIIPGDISANSEYVAHVQVVKKLEKFEKDTGLKVLVINGNHDINKIKSSTTFENGYSEPARALTPEEFRELYKNLGYDYAYHTYKPESGKAHMLSYSVRANGYRLIFMDTSRYSADFTESGLDSAETSGGFKPEFFDWIIDEIEDAKKSNEIVIGVTHHNLVPHFDGEFTVLRGFVMDDWEEITDRLADAGMHFVITGHIHTNDISQKISDRGETITDICTDSLTAFPNYFREIEMTTNGEDKTTCNVESYDVDCVLPVTVDGVTYPQPYRHASLGKTFFDEKGLYGLMERFIGGYIDILAEDFAEKGVIQTLKDMGLDIRGMLETALGDGVVIGNTEILTADNVMGFIEDFGTQVQEAYFRDPDATKEYLFTSLNKLLSVQMSELPNSRFYGEYGIGSLTEPGTFDDFLQCIFIYLYDNEYHMEDDPFCMDAIDGLENGDTIFPLFNALIDIVANDLLQEQLLPDIELRPGTLFPTGKVGHCMGAAVDMLLKAVFMGDPSLLNISNQVLTLMNKLGFVEYTSLWGIVEHYMDKYLTNAQLEGIGQSLANLALEFGFDNGYREDNDTVITYDGKADVEATRDNYRLPTNLVVTFGQDQTSRNISWYTKQTVTGSDIEIIDYTASPVFKGVTSVPAYASLSRSLEKTTRQYPGIDLGVFGIMNYEFPMNRHIVSVSGLRAGEKYLYRVGDASKNWWSDIGTIEIADGSQNTTFIHVTDPQSQSAKQYETFDTVIETAFSIYDSADYIINTGDCVDHGDNFRQWKWLFNGASETLKDTVMMAASGNHEDKGEYAIEKNYALSNVPPQDTITGVYYSFDYNNTHTAVLNTSNLDKDHSLNDEQIDWLIQDMESSDADWKFVALHKAAYSNGSHYKDDDVVEIRKQLTKLMPQLGIDVVFQGHDHVYLRTDSIIDNEVESVTTSETTFEGRTYEIKESPTGSVYAISGCSGVKVYQPQPAELTDKYFPRAEAIVPVDNSVFSGVKVVGDTLYFDAYEVNVKTKEATHIDSFAIRKDLSVKKGTGVTEDCDFCDIIKTVINTVTPLINWLLERIENMFHSNIC